MKQGLLTTREVVRLTGRARPDVLVREGLVTPESLGKHAGRGGHRWSLKDVLTVAVLARMRDEGGFGVEQLKPVAMALRDLRTSDYKRVRFLAFQDSPGVVLSSWFDVGNPSDRASHDRIKASKDVLVELNLSAVVEHELAELLERLDPEQAVELQQQLDAAAVRRRKRN